jgi:hypothetical protein
LSVPVLTTFVPEIRTKATSICVRSASTDELNGIAKAIPKPKFDVGPETAHEEKMLNGLLGSELKLLKIMAA